MKISSVSSNGFYRMRLLCLTVFIAMLALPVYADDASKPLPNLAAPSMDADSAINAEPDLKTMQTRASKGDPGAQEIMGERYADGDGVPKDSAKALKWYLRAAQQGNAKAQKELGDLYLKGDGAPQDFAQAYFWISLSLDPLDANSASVRDDLTKYLGPEQLTEQEKRLNEWKPVLEQTSDDDDDSADSDSGCTAKDVAASMVVPMHASADCKGAQKNLHFACSTPSCTDCETALNAFNAQCTRSDMDTADPAFSCDANADCFLLDKNCSQPFDPISVNREHLQEVRKKRNYPIEDCGRSPAIKQRFHALCINNICSVRTSAL
jgi:TPR repeat protein